MKLLFVHGWSVASTTTYGELPQVLQREAPLELNIEIENIYLGEYISFHDEVSLDDIARAFDKARRDKLGDEKFACITHSTGGPVIRLWVDLFFKKDLSKCPLSHLIMLAPANHGSSLAILGKGKLSRIKAWAEGVDVGTGVLNWLQLGSDGQWKLNHSWLEYIYDKNTFFTFVLSGEEIDEHFYDFINRYLVEQGSDGVIRLCGANMNYKAFTLEQDCTLEPLDAKVDGHTIKAYPLILQGDIKSSPESAFEVIPKASHTGDTYGIMESVKKNRVVKPVIGSILEALHVKTKEQYHNLKNEMFYRSVEIQKNVQRCVMFVFNVRDNYNNAIYDYDMLLLAGNEYSPSELPKGFFVDRQKNDMSGNLIYYLNYDVLKTVKDRSLGIRIIARPDEGFCHYTPAEFRSNTIELVHIFKANQTVMVDVILERRIAENTFVLETVKNAKKDFKDRKPSKGKL